MRRQFLCVAAVVLVASAATAQADIVYDAYTQFNSTSNTSSDRWQYFSVPDGSSEYSLLPAYGTFPYQSYNGWNAGSNFPAVGASGGEIKMQPDPTQTAAIGWKNLRASSTTITSVQFLVHDVDSGTGTGDQATYDGVGYDLYVQGAATPLATGYVANSGTSGTISITTPFSVGAGQMLYLKVNDGTMNNWYDTTGVSFTVTEAVPEPSSVVLLAFGVISLLAFAWRKRK